MTEATETRLARLEALPDALERIERMVERIAQRMEVVHRLEQQQQSANEALGRAFGEIEQLESIVDRLAHDFGSRLGTVEQTVTGRLGMAQGALAVGGAVLSLLQVLGIAVGTYLFTNMGQLQMAIADLRKADAVVEMRLGMTGQGQKP